MEVYFRIKKGIVFPCSSGGNPSKVKWISAVVKLFDFKYRLCFAVMWNQWLKCIKYMHYTVCTVYVWGNAAMVACVIGEENRIRQSVFFSISYSFSFVALRGNSTSFSWICQWKDVSERSQRETKWLTKWKGLPIHYAEQTIHCQPIHFNAMWHLFKLKHQHPKISQKYQQNGKR